MESSGIAYEAEMNTNAGATMQQMLMENIGKYVVCELLIGLRSMTVREGILIEVGRDYFILQDPNTGSSTSCDLYSLKFVSVPGTQPRQGRPAMPHHPYESGCGQTCAPHSGSGTSTCWFRVD